MENEIDILRRQVQDLKAEILSLKQKQHSSMQDSRSHIACEQAALDLQEEMKFREMFIQSLPGFFVAINSEGKTIFINDSMLQVLGYTKDEVVGRDYLATLVPESEREKVSRVFQELIHQNEPTISENHIVAKDGKELLMEWQGRYVLHENGKVDCFYGVGTNITKRKRSEEALRESESKYRRLYDSMMEAYVNTDMSGRIKETNLTLQTLLGYSEEEIKQLNYKDLTPKKWHAFESEIVKNQIIPRGYSDIYEKEYRKKDGTTFPVELRTFLLRDPSGQPISMWAIIRDITKRKREERALRESEARYRTLIENIPQAVLLKDRESRYISINKAYALAFGLHQEDVIGKSDYDFHPKQLADKSRQEDRLVMETGEGRELEEESVHNGQKRFYDKVKVPVRDSMGKIIGVLSTLSDITERKKAEEALRALSARQEAILSAVPEIIMEVDCNKVYRWSNQASVEFFGEDVIGKEAAFYFEGEQDTYATVQPLFNGSDEVFYVESWQRRRDGQKRLLAWWCRVLKDAQGTMTGALAIAHDITDRRRAEEELRESEARFRSLVESAPDAVFVQSAGRLAYLNSAACRLLGASGPKDLLGKHFMERIAPEYHDRIRERIRLQLETGESAAPMEQKYLRLDGSQVAVETTAAPIRYEGEDAHIVFIRDITARKQAEESLRESEAKFRQIVENTNEGIWTIDGQHRVVFVNQRMASMLGYSPEEMIGRGADSFIFAEDLQDHNEKMKRRQRGESAAYERRLLCKDGIAVWTIVSASPIMDAEGRFAGSYGMFTDITERKQAEDHLRLSQARYRTLVENIPQRVLLKDRNSNYLSINQAYGRAFGLNPENVIGKSDYDIHPRIIADKYRQEDRLVMETGESREFEEENVEGGKTRLLHKVKVPVRDSMGKIIGVLSTLSDITERLQLEEQFRHSQKMEAVGRLAGGVAHDFNNLLTVIGGHTEIALTRIDKNNPLHDSLQEVKIASDRAASLTRQLLAFSRRQVMEIKVLNLNTVIRDTEKMLRRLLGEDIAVITQPSENLGLVKADPGQIEQVLTNLAVNARDAMAEGGRLVIATDNLEITEANDPTNAGLKPGRYVRMSVSDTGHGMNPEVMSKIFEPFFTTKEQGKGTGLGLSTAFGIVKQSGGEIRVQSELENGTTFEIILPRVEEAEPVIGKKDLKEPPRGTETVLIIEDEKSVLKMATQLLKNQGYQIIEAPGSEDAMRVFEDHSGPIDLVLTDVVMPVCRGPALVERLKQLRDNFKVLYMSGYTDGGVGDLGVLRRGDNFIQKPFKLESLANKVRSVLDGE